jgi:chromosome segregation ATPase
MTADQRLDQLEPLVAQTLAVADRHTAQLNQINNRLNQLADLGAQQSNNVVFLLREVSSLKEQVGSIEQSQEAMDARIQTLDSKIETLNSIVEGMGSKVDVIDSKLDRLLDLLGNGK